jgi:DNA-binding NarL/FixJ family response regulator
MDRACGRKLVYMSEDYASMMTAGRLAIREGRWIDARDTFEQARAAKLTGEATEGLADAQRWLGDSATVKLDEDAFKLYRDEGDTRSAGRMATWLAMDNFEFRGDTAVLGGWLQRAHRFLDEDRECADYGWLLAWEAHIELMVNNDSAKAIANAVKAATIGRSLRIADLEVLALAAEGLALVTEGDVDLGMKRLDESCTAVMAGEVTDGNARATAICYLMDACDRARDYDRAEQWCARAYEIARQIHFESLMGVCRPHYAVVLMWHGRWKEAEEQLLLGNDEIRDLRPAMIVEGLVRLGELRWRQGRWDEAKELFEQVKHADLSQLGRAELALSLGRLEEAGDLVEKYLRRIPRHDRIERAFGLELGVRVAIVASRVELAGEYAAELAAIAAKVQTDPMLAASRLSQGLLAAAGGSREQARACFEDATDYYARHGAPFEEARARLELARSLAALGRAEQASRECQSAIETLDEIGAVKESERATSLLHQIDPLAQPQPPPKDEAGLSRRELEVLALLAKGLSNQEIATSLVLSVRTIERHISTIYEKLGAAGRSARAAASAYAVKRGII